MFTTSLKNWAARHPEAFPKDCKTLALQSGKLFFRTSPPKLAPLGRSFTWEKITALVRTALPAFLRTKEEVDREGLLSMAAQADDKAAWSAQLRNVGLRIVQEETFNVEPDLTKFQIKITEVV